MCKIKFHEYHRCSKSVPLQNTWSKTTLKRIQSILNVTEKAITNFSDERFNAAQRNCWIKLRLSITHKVAVSFLESLTTGDIKQTKRWIACRQNPSTKNKCVPAFKTISANSSHMQRDPRNKHLPKSHIDYWCKDRCLYQERTPL